MSEWIVNERLTACQDEIRGVVRGSGVEELPARDLEG